MLFLVTKVILCNCSDDDCGGGVKILVHTPSLFIHCLVLSEWVGDILYVVTNGYI